MFKLNHNFHTLFLLFFFICNMNKHVFIIQSSKVVNNYGQEGGGEVKCSVMLKFFTAFHRHMEIFRSPPLNQKKIVPPPLPPQFWGRITQKGFIASPLWTLTKVVAPLGSPKYFMSPHISTSPRRPHAVLLHNSLISNSLVTIQHQSCRQTCRL